MRIFADLFRETERLFERPKGVNKDFGPFQRDPQFLFFEKSHFRSLIFFSIWALHPLQKWPKLWKASEASNG